MARGAERVWAYLHTAQLGMPTQLGLCGFTPLTCIKWEYFSFAMEVSQLAGCAVCMDSYMMVAMAALVTSKGGAPTFSILASLNW